MLTHDCSKHESCPSCAALRARLAVLGKENKILEKVARGCLGTLFAETYLRELRALDAAKEGKG
jgi:hypothetical protein